MSKVAAFSFDHGLLGEGAQSADAIGMSFAGGVTTGDQGNLKLRFDPTYMQMAADGQL
jgi:NitT/TauT family transport system substrate-binding protein